MHPSDWSNLGWITLQDWDSDRAIGNKHVAGAMRMEAPEDPEDGIPDNLTEGHVLGGMYWNESGGRAGMDTWWLTPPAVSYFEPAGDQGEEEEEGDEEGLVGEPFDGLPPPALPVLPRPPPLTDADKATLIGTNPLEGEPEPDQTTTRTRSKGGGWSALVDASKSDPALPAKKPKLPAWARGTKYPVGWVSTILSGSKNVERGPQDEILLPGFFGLVAPNRGGVPAMGTTVWELNKDKVPDFGAHLQSLLSVEKVGGGALALQLGKANLDASSGFLLLSDWSDGDGVLASASNYQGGPFLTGGKGDQHKVGVSADGKQINAAHLSTQTLFKGPGFDCPLLFEASGWPKPDSGPHKILVHLVNDVEAVHPWAKGAGAGFGRWYADAFFYADDPPPPEDGPGLHGPEDPFGTGDPPPPGVGGGGDGVTGGGGGGGDIFVPSGGGGTGGGGPQHGAGGGGLPTGGIFGPGGSGIPFDPDAAGAGDGGGGDGFFPGGGPLGGGGLIPGGGGSGPGGGPGPGGAGGDPFGPGSGHTGFGGDGGFTPTGGGAGGDGDSGSVVFVQDSNGNLNPVVPPAGLSPEELKEWVEKNWGQDPPYDQEETAAVYGEEPASKRPKWAVASNTVIFGGGQAFKPAAYAAGEADLTGASSVSAFDLFVASRAPIVGYQAAYGQGDGTWDGWEYTAGQDGSDGARPSASGGTMLIPPDVTVAEVVAGTASSDVGAVTQVYPEGMSETAWGTPDPTTGGVKSGVIGRATAGGGFELVLVDGSGVEVGVGISWGEGGLSLAGAKVSIDGLLDPPTGVVLAEQASRPANWTLNTPGIYAGNNAGVNTPWWVRDDGTEADMIRPTAAGWGATPTAVLSGNVVLTDASNTVAYYDPGTATRTITLPTPTGASPFFLLANVVTSGFSLTVVDHNGATIGTLTDNTRGWATTDGLDWLFSVHSVNVLNRTFQLYEFSGHPTATDNVLTCGDIATVGSGVASASAAFGTNNAVITEAGTLDFVTHNTQVVSSTMGVKTWKNGSVSQTLSVDLSTSSQAIPSLSYAAEDYLAIEYDSGTNPQDGIWFFKITNATNTGAQIYFSGNDDWEVDSGSNFAQAGTGSSTPSGSTSANYESEVTVPTACTTGAVSLSSFSMSGSEEFAVYKNGSSSQSITAVGASPETQHLNGTSYAAGDQIAFAWESVGGPSATDILISLDGINGSVFHFNGHATSTADFYFPFGDVTAAAAISTADYRTEVTVPKAASGGALIAWNTQDTSAAATRIALWKNGSEATSGDMNNGVDTFAAGGAGTWAIDDELAFQYKSGATNPTDTNVCIHLVT